jgi:hypothetical protein
VLDRLRDSFITENPRAESLLEEVCRWIEVVHGVSGVGSYYFALEELDAGKHGEHIQGFEVIVNSLTNLRTHAGIHEMGHVLDGVFLNTVESGGNPAEPPLEFASDIAESLEGTARQGASILLSMARCNKKVSAFSQPPCCFAGTRNSRGSQN